MSVSHDLSPAKRIARLALPVSALLAVGLLAGCGKAQSIDYEKSAELVQPVAKVDLKPVTVAPGSRTGEQVVTSVCGACHTSGALNAPVTGDAGAWGPRIAQGFDALVNSAINGKNQMPPKGGAADLTDTEIARAVAYLGNKAGAKFTEPQ